MLTLWQRWWPAKPCLETLDDKIQDGYETLAQDGGAATDRWLDAWSDVLALCEAAGITMIAAFDARFPLTQSLYNWSQDLEMELGNAGHDDPAKLQARITVGEQVMRRFTDCDQLMIENWRRAIAEAWFGLGDTGKADELYRGWLDANPAWGFGWIGWASCYMPPGKSTPKNYQRAEDLLRRGHAVSRVRDRDAVADWLRLVCEETGRLQEARDFAPAIRGDRRPRPSQPSTQGQGRAQRAMPMRQRQRQRQRQEVQEMLSLQSGGSVIAHHLSSETRLRAGCARPGNDRAPAGQSGDQAARRVRTASGQVCWGA